MASPSSSTGKDKELEEKKDNESEEKKEEDYNKGKEKSKQSGKSDMHVLLDDVIGHQNMKKWQEKNIIKMIGPKWSVTEEEIEEMSMKTYDFDYVLKNHLLDEEIVWDDDVWGLQNIIKIPPTSHAKKDW